MRSGINIWQLENLIESASSCAAEITKGKWVPTRPYGWSNIQYKWKAIKLILSEKADLVIWPEGQ
jgi:hypothetical protein